MKSVSDCSVCLLKLAHTSAKAVSAPEPLRMEATKAALKVLANDDFTRVPPAIARDVLDAVSSALGTQDPFAQIKKEHNQKAMELVEGWAPGYIESLPDADERLEKAIRGALAGNSLDLATIPEQADPEMFESWLEVPWAVNHFAGFKDALEKSGDVLYLCDNAGELAFDIVLIKGLLARGKDVTVSVKGGPALNDATMEDALEVGLDRLEGPQGKIKLITTGQPNMGVDLENAPDEWKRLFFSAGVVVAKGQANLESLHDCGREVFFITLVKCAHVAKFYGLEKGSAMLYRGGMESGVDKG